MSIIAVANTKGGVGKTTLAVNLSIMRSFVKGSVLLVDSDEQGSALDFSEIRESALNGGTGYTCVSLKGRSIKTEVDKLKEKYDNIIIDVGGRNTDSLRAALLVSKVLVVPFLPTSLDVWGLENMSDLIEQSLIYNPDLIIKTVLNRADPVGNDNKEAIALTESIKHMLYSGVSLGNRKSFRNSISEGLAIVEMKNKDHKANFEVTSLYNEIFSEPFDVAINTSNYKIAFAKKEEVAVWPLEGKLTNLKHR